MPYCLVTGTAGLPNGAVLSNGTFTASRAPKITSGYEGRAVIPDAVTFVSDAAGYIEVSLMPGSYQVSEATTNNKFMLFVPEQATADFTDCVETASIVLTPSMVQDVFDARDAAEAAAATITSSFATRAEFITWAATSTVEDGTVIWADGLGWKKVSGATAISDMADWLPYGDWRLEHFGVVGATATSLATDTTPPTGATVDEASAIQAAFDAALAAGEDLYGDPSKVYGISSGVVWGLRNNTLSITANPTLIDVTLQVVGGTWTAGDLTNADPTLWSFGTAALTVGKTSGFTGTGKPRVSTRNVTVNAARLAPVGIHFRGASQSEHDASAHRALEAQLFVGAAPGGDDSLNCTDSKFTLRGSEFQYTTDLADGYNDYTVRTAVGLMVQSSDVSFSQVTISPSKYGVVLGTGYNIQIVNSKFWNGPARTDSNSRTLWVTTGAHNWVFSACQFDDGHLYFQSFDGKLIGNEHIQYGFSNAVTMEASAANETASDFIAVGNAFQYTSANLTTSGSGTWGTFGGRVAANKNTNNDAFTFGGYGIKAASSLLNGTTEMSGDVLLSQTANDYVTVNSGRGIRFMADYDNNSGTTQSNIDFGTDGTVWHRISPSGNFLFGYNQATGGGSVASFSWSGAKFIIYPSDGAGGTPSTGRLEYDPTTSTWGFYGDIAQYGSNHGFVGAGFASRSAFVTWASGKTFTDGTIVTASRRQYRYSSGATGISDLPNWLPFGPVYPDHFGYNATSGTTDMTAAILAAATYVKNTFTSGGTVWGSDSVYAVSAPIDVSGFFGVRFNGLNLTAIGTWTSGDPMFLISTASTASRVDISFINCNFEGAQKANGIKVKNYSRVLVKNCKMHGVPLYAVKTDTSAGELMIDGCQFRQYYSGESGYSVAANRTAKLIDISTPDAIVLNTVAAYGQYPIYVSGAFNHIQVIGCHFYDGGYTPASGQPYSAYFDVHDAQVIGNYFDTGIVRVVAGTTGVFSGNHLYRSGAAINTNGIEFYNTGASTNLAGLTIANNTSEGFTDATYVVLFTGSWNTDLKMLGGANAQSSGTPWTGLPLVGTGNNGVVSLSDSAFNLFNDTDPTAKARIGLGSVPTGTTTDYDLPNTSGTFLNTNASATINGTMTFVGALNVNDGIFTIRDGGDTTKKAQFQLSGITTGTTRTMMVPDADGTIAYTSATWAWSSITSKPTTISGYGITDGATLTGSQTLQNKTLDTTTTLTIKDTLFSVVDDGDVTKIGKFEASGITTATTRTYTLPNASGTLALLSFAQTFSALQTFSASLGVSSSVAFGYLAGTGGTVTQATSRTTGVTLDAVTGTIVLVSDAGAATGQQFTLTNNKIPANGILLVNIVGTSYANRYGLGVNVAAAGGSAQINLIRSSGTTAEVVTLSFMVLQAQVS